MLFVSWPYQHRVCFGIYRNRFGNPSGNPEENPKDSRRKSEGYTAKPEAMKPFPEALPKNATLLRGIYVGQKLFFVYYAIITNGLVGVAPPPPPLMDVFAI
ncbi:MAG TPA: hypothetical protein DHW64_11765 [Chitinophagaceae bacterium]|nr:hypothetical protein [Chitinophagaceae bacterium]